MSPYAEYPKNPRAQEWGRETIEMQENGSTKNLLQMTDVYYSVSICSLTINLLCLIEERHIPGFLEVQIPFPQNRRAKQMTSIDSKALGVLWDLAITCGDRLKEVSLGRVLGKCLGTFLEGDQKAQL